MAPLTAEVEMMTTLQNVKQGLKADCSDKEIAKTILQNLDFVDALIAGHLNGEAESNSSFVSRDAAAFREF